ncbi:uncharacterized protein [Anabrus simplex]|uniref:uncharacterized protein n=1 Tax=Anabrus simplex TaxID=316456 RepID=UPI0035A36055
MTLSLLCRMASEHGKVEKKRMKMKLRVLDKSDEELKIKNVKSMKSRDPTDGQNEENLFLLNVENEITAYSISKQDLLFGSKPDKEMEEQRNILANLENEITAHSICKPNETAEETSVLKPEMGCNPTKSHLEQDQNKLRLQSDSNLKSKEMHSNHQSNGKPNGIRYKMKKKRHNVEDSIGKAVYEDLEYLLEDEEIVLQNKAAEKYIIVDKGKDGETLSVQDIVNNLTDKDNESGNLSASERKRRRIENQRVVKKLLPDGTLEDMYEVLWETVSSTRLPSLLWSVHKAVDGHFVAFSHISPYSSDSKFIVDKVIMFGKDRCPVIFLRGVRVIIPNMPNVIEAPEHISSVLRRVDRLLLCLGYDVPMEKHSDQCFIYFERVGNSLTCHACLIEQKRLQQGKDGRKKSAVS